MDSGETLVPMIGLIPILRGDSSRKDFDLNLLDPATIRWAIHAGIGPLMYHLHRDRFSQISDSASRDTLRSADLAARLVMADMLSALEEILAASADMASEITLLKGISTCQYLYPEPHLRTMGDIDLLIPAHNQQRLETLLLDLGYRQQSSQPAEFYKTHHHSMPFFHPTKHQWVEIHTALLSNRNVVSDRVFSSKHVESQAVPVLFHGYKTKRLSYEQEIVYIAAHWAFERKCFVGGVIPLVDMMYMIQEHGDEIDWDHLLPLLDGSQTAVYLNLMLRFLQKFSIVYLPNKLMARIALTQKYPLGISETILHHLIENYSMRGKHPGRITSEANLGLLWETLLRPRPALLNLTSASWNILSAPKNPRRFRPSFQLARIARILGLRKQL